MGADTERSLLSRFRIEFSSQLISLAATGLLTVILARLLSPGDYGLFYLALAIFAFLSLFSNLGIPRSAATYVAEYSVADPGQVPHIVRRSWYYLCVACGLTALVLVLGHEYLATALESPDLAPLLVLGALFVIGTTVLGFLRGVLQGFERIHQCAVLSIVSAGIKLVCATALVLMGFGVIGALVGYIVAYAITAILGAVMLYRVVSSFDPAPTVEDGLYNRLLRYNVPIAFTKGSDVLDKQVDTILVGLFLTPVAVGYYAVSKQVVQFVQAPAAALGFTVSPAFGKQKAGNALEDAARTYESAVVYLLLFYVPAAAGIVLVAEPFITYTFGSDYLGAVPLLQILSIFIVLQALNQVTSNGLDFLGRARIRAVAKGVTAVANAALNVALIPTLGVEGAAIATVLTYSLYAGINVVVIAAEFPLRIGYLSRQLCTIGLITGVMSLLVYSLLEYIVDPVTFVAIVGLGGAVWLVLSALAGLVEVGDLRAAISA